MNSFASNTSWAAAPTINITDPIIPSSLTSVNVKMTFPDGPKPRNPLRSMSGKLYLTEVDPSRLVDVWSTILFGITPFNCVIPVHGHVYNMLDLGDLNY